MLFFFREITTRQKVSGQPRHTICITLGEVSIILFHIHYGWWQGCQVQRFQKIRKWMRNSRKLIWWWTIHPKWNNGIFYSCLIKFWWYSVMLLVTFARPLPSRNLTYSLYFNSNSYANITILLRWLTTKCQFLNFHTFSYSFDTLEKGWSNFSLSDYWNRISNYRLQILFFAPNPT